MVRSPGNLTSGNITNMTLNVPILCAAGGVALAVTAEHLAAGVALAVAAEHLAASAPQVVVVSFLSSTSFAIVLITTAYALFELVKQGWLARQQPKLAPGVCRSASFAAFFLGLISVAVSDTNTQGLQLAAAMGFCVLALAAFFALVLRGPTDTVSQEPAYDPERAGPYLPDSFPRSGSLPPLYGSEGVAPPSAPRIDPSTLPPVFESDPLYSIPRPRQARFFSVVKGNDIPVASDDACVISDDETHFALCDGASGSSLPRPWATLLGQQWLKQPFQEIDAEGLSLWLREPRERWHRWVQETWKWKIDERNQLLGYKPLSPDVFRRTLQTGASATFLGLMLNRESNTWQAVAIGDTCLFLCRRGKSAVWRARSFPLDKSGQFSDRPPLLTSNGNNVATLITHFRYTQGSCRRGDVLMMATDALSQWLLSQIEQRQSDWNILPWLTDPRRFAELVEKERQSGHMVDDDTTLVVIPM